MIYVIISVKDHNVDFFKGHYFRLEGGDFWGNEWTRRVQDIVASGSSIILIKGHCLINSQNNLVSSLSRIFLKETLTIIVLCKSFDLSFFFQ